VDFKIARQNMVRNQIIRRGVRDERVIATMLEVPRHLFVDRGMQSQAYSDNALPLLRGQTISQPLIVASMTELLDLSPELNVLEIGTGSGYQSAVLALLCHTVHSIERIIELAELAQENLEKAGIRNVRIRCADGSLGWPEMAPFDRIIITAGAPVLPDALFSQLKEGGRMVAPVGTRTVQTLQLIEKVNGAPVVRRSMECVFVPLIGEHGWKE